MPTGEKRMNYGLFGSDNVGTLDFGSPQLLQLLQ